MRTITYASPPAECDSTAGGRASGVLGGQGGQREGGCQREGLSGLSPHPGPPGATPGVTWVSGTRDAGCPPTRGAVSGSNPPSNRSATAHAVTAPETRQSSALWAVPMPLH